MQSVVLLLSLFLGLALSQGNWFNTTLYPITADGFDTVILTDMSFVTEIHYQTDPRFNPGTNLTFFIFGIAAARTVYTAEHTFFVGPSPSDAWFLPFVDIHSFQNGTDTWFIGPTDPVRAALHSNMTGYGLEIAVLNTKLPFRQASRWAFAPIGFQGTFFSAFAFPYAPNNVVAYFAGFFTNSTGSLLFGVTRVQLNLENIYQGSNASYPAFSFNPALDQVTVYERALYVTYNQDYKPFLWHVYNQTWLPTPDSTTTYTYILDPYINTLSVVQGNIDPSIPLTLVPGYARVFAFGLVVSAQLYYQTGLLIVGIQMPGTMSGSLVVLNLASFTLPQQTIQLPANMSNPQALVVDQIEGVVYVALNGGGAVLRYNITGGSSLQYTGMQVLPFYLHRAWAGLTTFHHVYFVTNEQVSKVFRVSKWDFCDHQCPEWAYCQSARCVCPPFMRMKDGYCQWQEILHEQSIIKRDHGGEVALGIFFMLSTLAAIAGWFAWYRNRRHSYQSV